MKKLKIWLKIDIFGELALRHVNLLFQKTTADDDDDLNVTVTDNRIVKFVGYRPISDCSYGIDVAEF